MLKSRSGRFHTNASSIHSRYDLVIIGASKEFVKDWFVDFMLGLEVRRQGFIESFC